MRGPLRRAPAARARPSALNPARSRRSPPACPPARRSRQERAANKIKDNEARGIAWRAASAHNVAADSSKISIFGSFARKDASTVGKVRAGRAPVPVPAPTRERRSRAMLRARERAHPVALDATHSPVPSLACAPSRDPALTEQPMA